MPNMPYDFTNCFRFDGWASPEHTVARPEADDILAAVMNRQRIFVDGPRRCGKTTLIINTLESHDIPVLRLDLDGVETCEKLLERIARDTNGFLDKHPEVRTKLTEGKKTKAGAGANLFGFLSLNYETERDQPARPIGRSLDSLLSAVDEVARAAGAVVFCDEFQAIKSHKMANPTEVLGSFAAISDPARTRGSVPYVFAGSNRHAMHALFHGPESAFFQRTRNLQIGPIPEETIIPFLNSRIDAEVAPEVGREAYLWTDGIPGDLQRLYSATQRVIGDRKIVTMADLEAAKTSIINDIGRSYTLTLQALRKDELEMLDVIASRDIRNLSQLRDHIEGKDISVEDAQKTLFNLAKLGLINVPNRTFEIARPEPIMFRYLERYPAINHHPQNALFGVSTGKQKKSSTLSKRLTRTKTRSRSYSRDL